MFNLDNFLAQNQWRLDRKVLDFYYFPRECLPDWTTGQAGLPNLISHLVDNKPLLIKGPRGAGKTTILKILIKHLISEKNILPDEIFYFNLDDPMTRDLFNEADSVINFVKGFNSKPVWLIVDGIQCLSAVVNNPLILLKELFGKINGNLIMTSSVANFTPDIKDMIQVSISSFSYKDYLKRMLTAQNIPVPELEEHSVEKLSRLMQSDYPKLLLPYLESYLNYGGYPAVIKEFNNQKRPEILRQVYQETIKEILAFTKEINQPDKFNGLIQIIASETGLLQNMSLLAQKSGLNRATVERYLELLINNYIISAVYPYKAESTEKSGTPLIYFTDIGFRNILLSLFHGLDLMPDREILLDNFLCKQLTEFGESYGRAINFLRIERSSQIIFRFSCHNQINPVRGEDNKSHKIAVNHLGSITDASNGVNLATVLYDFPRRKSGRRGLISLSQRFKPERIFILTRDYFQYEQVKETTFIYLPATMAYLLPEILRVKTF